jgi:hypothetical protein
MSTSRQLFLATAAAGALILGGLAQSAHAAPYTGFEITPTTPGGAVVSGPAGPGFSSSGGNAEMTEWVGIGCISGACGFDINLSFVITGFNNINHDTTMQGGENAFSGSTTGAWSLYGQMSFSGSGTWGTGAFADDFQSTTFNSGGLIQFLNSIGSACQAVGSANAASTGMPGGCDNTNEPGSPGSVDTALNNAPNGNFDFQNSSVLIMSTDVWADMGGLYILGLELHNGATATIASCVGSTDVVCLSTGSDTGANSWAVRAVPEPTTLAILGGSLLGFGFFRRRRKS